MPRTGRADCASNVRTLATEASRFSARASLVDASEYPYCVVMRYLCPSVAVLAVL